ncbi:hypothetical protein KWH71_23315, partial [Enterobacter sichuanensis]
MMEEITMKKRVAAILLTVTMTVSALTGCAGTGQEKETQASGTGETAGSEKRSSDTGKEAESQSSDGKAGDSNKTDAKSDTAQKPFEGQTITWVSQGVGDNAW